MAYATPFQLKSLYSYCDPVNTNFNQKNATVSVHSGDPAASRAEELEAREGDHGKGQQDGGG